MSPDAAVSSEVDLLQSRLWHRRAYFFRLKTLCIFVFAYLVAWLFGNFSQAAAAPFWFPDSVLLCVLLLTPRREWWLYLAIAVPVRFIPTLHNAVPLWFLIATTVNDMVKAALTAYLLRRLPNGSIHPATMAQFATFLGVAVFFVPGLSAFAGAATRHLLGYGFWASWYQWFLGDAIANLVLTPALLYWCSKHYRVMQAHISEIAVWLACFALSLLFAISLARSSYAPIALCVPVPFLIWAATRFGLIGASTPIAVIAMLSAAILGERLPLFSMEFESKSVLFLQIFLFVISSPVLAVAVLIEERSSVEKNLRESQETLVQNYREVRHLAGKLISAQDDERMRIALELHDDVVQRLALLAIQLGNLDKNVPPHMTQAHRELLELRRGTDQAVEALRDLSHQLHSPALQYAGLPAALNDFCRTMSQHHQISIKVEAEKPKGSSYDVDLSLFRIIQEALSNIIKHSNASEVTVLLVQNADQLRLEIRDDGIGFNPSEPSNGLGLISMRERVRQLNGTILMESAANSGTRIQVHVPLHPIESTQRAASADAPS